MFRRRGSWRAALGLGRPRCSKLLPASGAAGSSSPSLVASSTTTFVTTRKAATKSTEDAACDTSSCSITQVRSTPITLAALSETVVQTREHALAASPLALWPEDAVFPEQVGTLQQALATRDAYRVFCAVLQQNQELSISPSAVAATPTNTLATLLGNAEQEAASVATLLCACVAVVLRPADWPSWVATRFSSFGAAALPTFWRGAPEGGAAATAWTASSPLHAVAAHTLRHLACQLPRSAPYKPSSSSSSSTSPLPLLRFLSQLCGVCLAPSPQVALRLAQEAGQVSLDAAGVALKAYCDAGVAFVVNSGPAASTTTAAGRTRVAIPRETQWLSLWTQVTQPSAAVTPPAVLPFSLATAVYAGGAASWSDGINPAVLREGRVSWHLHCLLTTKATDHAARLLTGTLQDAAAAACDSSEEDDLREGQRGSACVHGTAARAERVVVAATLPVTHTTQAELLAALPLWLLDEGHLGERLSFSLLAVMQHHGGSSTATTGLPRPPWSFVPAVSNHSVVYARMLRYVLSSTAQVQRESSYVQHLHDLAALLSSANVHDLAASFVPADQPLTAVMVAAKDAHREEHVQQLVGAVRAVVDVLCEEPTPQPQAAARRRMRTRRTDLLSLHQRRTASDAFGAVSWKWREEVMDDVDGAVQAAVHLLTSLLELCANRSTSLPLRASEPKWRRELRERTAVRAHKFELLLQELPHAEIKAVLHTLLAHGYHREGSQLGVSLLKGDQVDLHYYTLPLLGSLYLAVSTSVDPPLTPATAKDEDASDDKSESDRWKQAVYTMYRRRFEIYGDADFNVTAPSFTTTRLTDGSSTVANDTCDQNTSSAATPTATSLVCTPESTLVEALVLTSTIPTPASLENGTMELANCLLNRRVVVAGRGVVVDVGAPYSSLHRRPAFGSWIRKGTATL